MKTDNQYKTVHLLVVDDDPIFRASFKKAAENSNVKVTTASSLKEINPMAVPNLFDVVVLDYYLDNIKENLKGTDVAYALEATPIILTSATDHVLNENEPWSNSIRKFVPKKNGVPAMLSEVKKIINRDF